MRRKKKKTKTMMIPHPFFLHGDARHCLCFFLLLMLELLLLLLVCRAGLVAGTLAGNYKHFSSSSGCRLLCLDGCC